MNNADYWKQRFEQLEDAQNALGEKTLGEIEKQYNDTLELLEARILLWYQRLADNNGISLAAARAWLGSSELREFRWTVKEYIKYGKENALNQKWVKELENASAKYHISKLEALKIQTRQSLEAMYAKQGKTMQKAFSDIYRSGYYHTAYEIQHGMNIGWDISGIDQPQIEKVLSKPWAADGYNFSERIWKNKNKLISEVHTSLVQNIQLGADPQKAINDIAAKMKTSKRNAGRLVMTEEAYFSSAAQKDCFVSLGVEEYEIVATIDNHTSDICRTLDKKHFPVKDYQAGVTAPPFHVYCRSTTAPYFDDEFDVPGERAARDKDGNIYYIPADMNYREWEKTFVNTNIVHEAKGKKNKIATSIIIDNTSDSKPMTSQLQNELSNEYDKFTETFGKLDNIRSVTAVPYQNNGVWGAYNDNSYELYLFGTGGNNGKSVMTKTARVLHKSGDWSTNSPYHAFRHELGHALQNKLRKNDKLYPEKLKKIAEIRNNINRQLTNNTESDIIKSRKSILSEYGLNPKYDLDEFISECIAEYCNGNPRDTAKSVVKILLLKEM